MREAKRLAVLSNRAKWRDGMDGEVSPEPAEVEVVSEALEGAEYFDWLGLMSW